jgi:ribosomal protein S6--L-glutamate ligase
LLSLQLTWHDSFLGFGVRGGAASNQKVLLVKIAILSLHPLHGSTRRLTEAGQERGHELQTLRYADCSLTLASGSRTLSYHGAPVESFDAIIPRIGREQTDYGCAIVRQFQLLGVISPNSGDGIARSRDNLATLQQLTANDVSVPVTTLGPNIESVDRLVEQVGGLPAAIKLVHQTQTNGHMVVAKSKRTLRSVVQAFAGLSALSFVQEYIRQAKVDSIRAIVVGAKIAASMHRDRKRSSPSGEHVFEKVRLTPEERSTCLRAAKAIGLQLAGVDLIRTSHGPVVLDVTPTPSIDRAEAATGVDIARQVVELLEKQFARMQKRPQAASRVRIGA